MAPALVDRRVEELGGPGWRIREQTRIVDTVDPWPAPIPAAKRRTAWRRLATAGIILVVFCASGIAATALSPSNPSEPAARSGVAPRATGRASTQATVPPQPAVLLPSEVKLAARDYAKAVAPLNKALDNFEVALHMANSQPCKCTEGAFDGAVAVKQIPGILTTFSAVQTTLQHMKSAEVPGFGASIDSVANAYQQLVVSFSAAYQAYQAADTAGVDTNLQAVRSEETAAQPALSALRAVLTLGLGPSF